MGSMSGSSCRCCMFVSCVVCAIVHPIAVLNSFILHDLQFVNAGRGCKGRPYVRGVLQGRSHNFLIGSHECLLLFTPSCCSKCFYLL